MTDGIQHVVDDLSAGFAREYGLAGLAVGVVRDGALAHTASAGYASIAQQRRVTAQSVFRVGSISKTFTGIAIMQLVADGRVALDAPVNDYLRHYRVEAPQGAPAVTLRHLLTHTSGIGELRQYSDVLRPFIGMGVPQGRPVPSFGDYYAPALTAEVPAGQKWAYSNHGFATLGAVVEDVTAEPFADYVRHEILDPFAMTASDFVRNDRVDANLCDGYALRRGRNKLVRYLDIVPSPAGSLLSNVDDMARYVSALCAGGAPVIDRAQLAEMISPQYRIDPRLPAIGLAFFLSDVEGHRVVGHDGGVNGFVSYLRVAPDDGVGVVVLTNSANMKVSLAIDRFGDELLRAALNSGGAARKALRVDETPAAWPELCGIYGLRPGLNTNARSWFMLGGEVEVFVLDNRLLLRAFLGPARSPRWLIPVDAGDAARFEFDFGAVAVDVAFSEGAIHLGMPLNMTLFRREHSFRRRGRFAAIAAAAATATAWRLRRFSRRRCRRTARLTGRRAT